MAGISTKVSDYNAKTYTEVVHFEVYVDQFAVIYIDLYNKGT